MADSGGELVEFSSRRPMPPANFPNFIAYFAAAIKNRPEIKITFHSLAHGMTVCSFNKFIYNSIF